MPMRRPEYMIIVGGYRCRPPTTDAVGDSSERRITMKRAALPACLLVSFVAACAKAADVTVSPENMQGWVIVTHKGAKAELVNHGPAVYEREKAFTADDGKDLG